MKCPIAGIITCLHTLLPRPPTLNPHIHPPKRLLAGKSCNTYLKPKRLAEDRAWRATTDPVKTEHNRGRNLLVLNSCEFIIVNYNYKIKILYNKVKL